MQQAATSAPAVAAAVIAQPTKAPPSRAGKIALSVVLVFGALFVLMIVIGLLTSPGRTTDTAASSSSGSRESAVEPAALVREAEPEKVQASLLIAAYQRNEIAADQAFKGKTFEIEGVVESVAKDILDTPYVTLDREGFRSVQAMFSRRSANALADLRPGQRIVVRCKVDGLMMNVLASDCLLR